MEDFSSTGQLVTLGLVDSSIGAMAKGLALVDVETSIAKELPCPCLLISHESFDSRSVQLSLDSNSEDVSYDHRIAA